MNNEKFKAFVGQHIDRAISVIGEKSTRELFETLPGPAVYFIAGTVFGIITSPQGMCWINNANEWRDEKQPRGGRWVENLNDEERRRLFDLVQLRFSTGSTSS